MTTISDTMNTNTPETTLTHRWGWLLALGIVQIIGALTGAAIGGLAENAAAEQTRKQLAARASSADAALLEQKARNYRRAMSACLEGRAGAYAVRVAMAGGAHQHLDGRFSHNQYY
jgi:hypothetical protein